MTGAASRKEPEFVKNRKKVKDIAQKVVTFLGKAVLVLFVVIFGWGIMSSILTDQEQEDYPPIGRMVQVGAETIHVYEQGSGGNTFVLMSGLGTTAPALDFEPLVKELSGENTVVVVEPAGYGWSSGTTEERTVENIVEEYRAALEKADVAGPYVLVPHSVAGIYAAYYQKKYPDEVSGIVGIDGTLPAQMDYFEEYQDIHVPAVAKLAAPCGLIRLLTFFSPESFVSENKNDTYSEDNIKMQKAISSWRGYNSTVINETNHVNENIEKTKDITFPSNMPLLFFTYERDGKRDDGKTSESFYETYITNPDCQKVMVLDGSHYLHWTCSEEMAEAIEAMFT